VVIFPSRAVLPMRPNVSETWDLFSVSPLVCPPIFYLARIVRRGLVRDMKTRRERQLALLCRPLVVIPSPAAERAGSLVCWYQLRSGFTIRGHRLCRQILRYILANISTCAPYILVTLAPANILISARLGSLECPGFSNPHPPTPPPHRTPASTSVCLLPLLRTSRSLLADLLFDLFPHS